MTHTCHARGCTRPVKPELLMCAQHWFMVPTSLRWPVIRNYRRGQCDDKKPSREWVAAARAAIDAVAQAEGR